MSETQETPVLSPALYLQREGVRQYSATNPRGAQVLLKIAVAGCNAMSSDKRLTDRLGEDFEQVVAVSAQYLESEDRFTHFDVELIQDLSSVDEEERQKMIRRASGAIERNCTIGHTVTKGATYEKTFTNESVSED